jgi:hypothetical protein
VHQAKVAATLPALLAFKRHGNYPPGSGTPECTFPSLNIIASGSTGFASERFYTGPGQT